jgi:hypothetical protein
MGHLWRREIVVETARRAGDRLVARIRIGGRREEVFFRSPTPLVPTDDPFLPVAALLGMKTGARVRLEGPVSAPLVASLDAVQEDLRGWYPHLHPLRVSTPNTVFAPASAVRDVAAFFSGGLDSFYTALAHAGEITHLVFVHGFDVALGDAPLRALVAGRVRAAAAELGKPLWEVETDLRRFSDRYADWSWFSHAGLIAVALLIAPSFREILVAATLSEAHRPKALCGNGNGETWSSGLARIRSDGTEATRPEKARVVADHPAACRHLRVCWENRDGAYNCGRCPKCLRTMLNLEVAGVRDRFETFPPVLDEAAIRRLPTSRRSDRQLLEESLWMAEAQGRSDLAALLRRCLAAATG